MSRGVAWIREDLSLARLLTERGEEVWRAPARPENDEPADAFALRDRASQAAHWFATQLGAGGRLSVLCVDVEDAACLFASAPSADPEVVAAAMRAGAVNYDALALRGTMQPLSRAATSPPRALSSPTLERLLKRSKPNAGARAPGAVRTAVLATPDSLVRLFLDQLDRRGVRVGVVQSLWHSMATAWASDRSAASPPAPPATDDTGVASSDIGPLDAVVLEDSGRLLWSWSRRGSLVAAGELSVRRAGVEGSDRAEGAQWNSEDWFPVAASRLSLDWLTWSTHLGQSPARIRVVGTDAKDLARTIDERWSRVDVEATAQNDPIGATLRAVAQREESALPSDDDPTRTLVALSRRRGRAHATLYTWSGVATGLLAVAIFALGWRALEKRTRLSEAAAEVQGVSAMRVREVAPELANNPDRARALESELLRLRKDRPQISDPAPARPVLDEFARLMDAFNALSADGLFFQDIQINETLPSALVRLPNFETGERLRELLRRSPGQIDWNVQFQREIGQGVQDWRLTGQWARTEAQR